MTKITNKVKSSRSSSSELVALYKKWPDIKRYLRSIGCPSADAEDIFQEALLVYSRKKADPTFTLTVAPFHYVKSTCKFIWYNQSRKEAKHQKVELSDQNAEIIDDQWFQKEMKLQLIEKALSKLGKQCQELLQLFYGKGWSMVDIAKKIGLRNDKVAKVQKYRCLAKAKDEVRKLQSQSFTVNIKN
ncbi:MAG: RNA polymerase sigma factor (sigma-70 family) [Flavobacteriaceae bacterium]|jgi:RNA polymerase sigma factor (sigma-70 family)